MPNNTYETITNHIIASLEAGVIPWRKEWKTSGKNGGGILPFNLQSGKAYRGVNLLTLFCSDYASSGWATYKQAQAMGFQVRKGEKSTPVIWWSFPTKEQREAGRAPYAKLFRVFNVEQLDGVPAVIPTDEAENFNPIASADRIVNGYMAGPSHPELAHGGSSAYFAPSKDLVQMPPRDAFVTPEAYYSTLFHEFVHSTGVKGRCDREELKGIKRFGDCEYSKEELTAEFGAAFLCGEAGIQTDPVVTNHVAYIQNWISKLQNDKTLAVQAAQRAQKAADFILGRKWDDKAASESESEAE